MNTAGGSVALGVALAAAVALVGFLLKLTLKNILSEVQRVASAAERAGSNLLLVSEKMDVRVTKLEHWRIRMDERHDRKDRDAELQRASTRQ